MITIVVPTLILLALLVAFLVFRKRISEKIAAWRNRKQGDRLNQDYAVVEKLATQLRTTPTWTNVLQGIASIFPHPLLDSGAVNTHYDYFWSNHSTGWEAEHPQKKRKEKKSKEKSRKEETPPEDVSS